MSYKIASTIDVYITPSLPGLARQSSCHNDKVEVHRASPRKYWTR